MKHNDTNYYGPQAVYLHQLSERPDAPPEVRREAFAELLNIQREALSRGIDIRPALVQAATTPPPTPIATVSATTMPPPQGVDTGAFSRRLRALASHYEWRATRLWQAIQDRHDALASARADLASESLAKLVQQAHAEGIVITLPTTAQAAPTAPTGTTAGGRR